MPFVKFYFKLFDFSFVFLNVDFMSSKKSMGIRLDPEDRQLLEELAVSWRINAADIVRMAIKSLLDEAKKNGGKIELPFDLNTKPNAPQKSAQGSSKQ